MALAKRAFVVIYGIIVERMHMGITKCIGRNTQTPRAATHLHQPRATRCIEWYACLEPDDLLQPEGMGSMCNTTHTIRRSSMFSAFPTPRLSFRCGAISSARFQQNCATPRDLCRYGFCAAVHLVSIGFVGLHHVSADVSIPWCLCPLRVWPIKSTGYSNEIY